MNFSLTSKEIGCIAKKGATSGKHSNEYYIIQDNNLNKYVILELKSSYAIYDYKFHKEISCLSWHIHSTTGYINHTVNNTFAEKYPDYKSSSIYLHQFIMQYCIKSDKVYDTIDHINWQKNDNRSKNLRWASQSEQNNNRSSRSDKKIPMQELIDIGIKEYPKYIRYDNSQERYVIEKHPILIKMVENKLIKKPIKNGTRTGDITNKFKNICNIGIDLDNQYDVNYKNLLNKIDILYNEYIDIKNYCYKILNIDIELTVIYKPVTYEKAIDLINSLDKIENEEWIDFTPGEFTYKISNKGRIKLLNSTITQGSIVKNTKYSQVQLSISKKSETAFNKKKYYVHKLVFEAFNGDTNKVLIIYDDNAQTINGAYRNWLEDMKLHNSVK